LVKHFKVVMLMERKYIVNRFHIIHQSVIFLPLDLIIVIDMLDIMPFRLMLV